MKVGGAQDLQVEGCMPAPLLGNVPSLLPPLPELERKRETERKSKCGGVKGDGLAFSLSSTRGSSGGKC